MSNTATMSNAPKDALKDAKDAVKDASKAASGGAKDIQDVLALQTHYAQSQMHTYALQAQELGRLMADAVKNKT